MIVTPAISKPEAFDKPELENEVDLYPEVDKQEPVETEEEQDIRITQEAMAEINQDRQDEYGGEVKASLEQPPVEREELSKVDRLSKEFNVSPTFVQQNLEEFEKHSKSQALINLQESDPSLAEWIRSNPNNAHYVAQDIERYKSVSKMANNIIAGDKIREKEEWIPSMSHAFGTSAAQVEKSMLFHSFTLGTHDDDFYNEYARQTKAQNERAKNIPEYYKSLEKEFHKESAERAKAWASLKETFSDEWEGNFLETLSRGGDVLSEVFDQIAVYGRNPKAGMYEALQSSANSFAPTIVGAGSALGTAAVATPLATAVLGTLALPAVPVVAAGAALGTAFVGAAFATSSVLTGVALESAATAEQLMIDRHQVDFTNPASIKAAFENPEIWDQVLSDAAKKGLTIATIDTALNMLGGKMFGKATGFKGKAQALAKASTIEPVGEATGEFVGTAAAGEEPSFDEAFKEGMSSIFMMGGMSSVGYSLSTSNEARKGITSKVVNAAVKIREESIKAQEDISSHQELDDMVQKVQEAPEAERPQIIEAISAKDDGETHRVMQIDAWHEVWGVEAITKADELLPNGRADLLKENEHIKIPLASLVGDFATSGAYDKVKDQLRRDISGFTLAEATELTANVSGLMKQVSFAAKRELERLNKTKEFQQIVQDEFEGMLINTGFKPEQAKKYAILRASQVATFAGIEGIDPTDFDKRRKLVVQKLRGQLADTAVKNFQEKTKAEKAEVTPEQTEEHKKQVQAILADKFPTAEQPVFEGEAQEIEEIYEPARPLTLDELPDDVRSEAEEYISDEISRMDDEIQNSTPSIKGRGTSIPNPEGGPDINIVLNEDSTFPKWFANLDPKGKMTKKKWNAALKSKKTMHYEPIKLQAMKNLLEGVESAQERIEPDAEFRALLGYDPVSVFHEEDGTTRGFLDISDRETLFLGLFNAANEATVLHELGHVFLEDMKGLVERVGEKPEGPKQEKFITDANLLLKELGVESYSDIKTEHHEQFARMFEAYLLEGKAPSPELKGAFQTFKTWLTSIYRNLRGIEKSSGLKLNLNDEMRGLFDRMLVAEEAIAEESRDKNYDKSGMREYFEALGYKNYEATENSPARYELDAILLAHEESDHAAELELYQKQLKQLQLTHSEEYRNAKTKLTKEIGDELKKAPIYVLWEDLKKVTPEERIRWSDIKEIRPDIKVTDLAKSFYHKNGQDIAYWADEIGLTPSQLVDLLVETPSLQVQIDKMVGSALSDQFPEYIDPKQMQSLKVAALDAVGRDRAKALKLEFELMMKNFPAAAKSLIAKIGNRLPTTQENKVAAQERIGKTVLEGINPRTFEAMETRARRDAVKFLRAGDMIAAVKSKLSELFNYQLAREAREANLKVEQALKDNKQKLKRSNKDLKKIGNIEMLETAQVIMAQYSMTTFTQENNLQAQLLKIEKYDKESFAKISGMVGSLLESEPTHYKNLTFDEFQEVDTVINSLYNMAVEEKVITLDGQKLQVEDVVEGLNTQTAKQPKQAVRSINKLSNWIKHTVHSLFAVGTRVEHLTTRLGGAWKDVVWKIADLAQTNYDQDHADRQIQLTDIVNKHFKKLIDSNVSIDARDYFKDTDPNDADLARITPAKLVMIMIHTGNKSNLRKLLLGNKWGSELHDGSLNDFEFSKFRESMIEKGILTEDIMDGVQKYWDLMDNMKSGIQLAYKKVNGQFFDEVDSTSFQMFGKEYKGGYAPAITDPLQVLAQADRDSAVSTEMGNAQFTYAHTSTGMTKNRVEYNKPLDLDLSRLRSHVERAVRYTHIEPAITDLNKLLNNEEVTNALFEQDNHWSSETFKPWLVRLATQQTTLPEDTSIGRQGSRMLGYVRRNANMQLMFANVFNTVENLTDTTILLTKMSPKELYVGFREYSKHHGQTKEYIAKHSKYMQTRMHKDIFEINAEYQQILTGTGIKGKVLDLQATAAKHTYVMQRSVQNIVEISAWMASHEKNLVAGMTEAQAAKEADALIRLSFGGARPIDVSKLESGGAISKVLFTFYSYFLNRANYIGHSTTQEKKKMAFYGVIAPAIASALLRRLFAGKLDLDDDDEIMDDVFDVLVMSPVRYAAALLPMGGKTLKFIEGQMDRVTWNDKMSLSPTESAINTVASPAKIVRSLFTDEELTSRDIGDAMTFFGVVTGLPIGVLRKPTTFMLDLESGKQSADNPLHVASGLLTGKSPTTERK